MILVVADSSPIRYLIVIREIEALQQLYDRIVLPSEVLAELTHPNAPSVVQEWVSSLSPWIEVVRGQIPTPPELSDVLDPGEAAAITLAHEMHADFVLLDEREARRMAIRGGLRIAGTVGILELAAEKGLIDLAECFQKLQATNFRIEKHFLQEALTRDATRRKMP